MQSNDKIVFAKLAPGTGKSRIIYDLYTKLENCVIVTEPHLVHQLQKQFDYYSENAESNWPIQQTLLTPTNTRYLIIDEFKEEQLEYINLNKYSKIYCFNCWYPEKIKIDYEYSLKQAIDDGTLCNFKTIKCKLTDALKNEEIRKGLVVVSKNLKVSKLKKYISEDRFIFQRSDEKFRYITQSQIEGLSVPFVNAIIYHPADFNKYQKVQVIGRVLRKDPKNKNKIALIFEV